MHKITTLSKILKDTVTTATEGFRNFDELSIDAQVENLAEKKAAKELQEQYVALVNKHKQEIRSQLEAKRNLIKELNEQLEALR